MMIAALLFPWLPWLILACLVLAENWPSRRTDGGR